MKPLTKRIPGIAGILSFFVGPIGYCYIGLNFFISGIFVWTIFSTLFAVNKYPLPNGTEYLQLFVYSFYGYKLAVKRNLFIDANIEMNYDIKVFRSFSFSIVFMLNVFIKIAQLYSLFLGLFFTYKCIVEGKIYLGFIILFAIPLTLWALKSFMSFLSGLLLKHFNIDGKYLQ